MQVGTGIKGDEKKMSEKYLFKRGQEVAFTPEEGVIVTGKVVGFGSYVVSYRRYNKVLTYNVEELDGTMWNCDESALVAVEEVSTVQDVDPLPDMKEAAQIESINLFFIKEVATRTYNCVARAGCETVWDLIQFAKGDPKTQVRNFGKKSETDLCRWLDKKYPGWRKL